MQVAIGDTVERFSREPRDVGIVDVGDFGGEQVQGLDVEPQPWRDRGRPPR
jgi:hypothetical protein